jgi:hydrogenase maturation factor
MCLGAIAVLADAWDDGPARVGRLADGTVVPLTYVTGARPGDHLLVHLGIPVEVLDADTAREALALRNPDDERVDR